jgi:hypothetical protein
MRVTRQNEHAVSTTVGKLIGELCCWPDHAVVILRNAEKQEFRFSRIERRADGAVSIELEESPSEEIAQAGTKMFDRSTSPSFPE